MAGPSYKEGFAEGFRSAIEVHGDATAVSIAMCCDHEMHQFVCETCVERAVACARSRVLAEACEVIRDLLNDSGPTGDAKAEAARDFLKRVEGK